MSTYLFLPMTEEYAALISHWKYDEPYSVYSMDGSKECITELLNCEYYYALHEQNGLFGYVCKGESARVPGGYGAGIYNDSIYVDIGLGLRPDITGQGKGLEFLILCMHFLREQFNIHHFRLVVASFNERAIKVYERAGFVKGITFQSNVDGQDMDFTVMRYTYSTT
ncbi:GCN5 family acetyltransferase [Cohnella kolymensis]|uniref:GCN5 family acetyltransferase n=1 Tax=Cohnella kolymensis TaxID=1590652 RepID=A0ABR5A6W3_9BACL|nr:GNAT family protein [Cohnella kolymensis]KIL35109.1 GCN5 family acetyltransferase [Cohnella kolymensis]KIL36518.1 GCN5 family acetyltransferase [Cohnella kolymensis]